MTLTEWKATQQAPLQKFEDVAEAVSAEASAEKTSWPGPPPPVHDIISKDDQRA